MFGLMLVGTGWEKTMSLKIFETFAGRRFIDAEYARSGYVEHAAERMDRQS